MDGYYWTVGDGVARLTLNRPATRNSIDAPLMRRLHDDLRGMADNAEVRCVVITGEGAHFSSGAIMSYFESLMSKPVNERACELERDVLTGGMWMEAMEALPQPVIASVRGAVGGSGMAFVLSADFVIASETSFFTVAHIKLGNSPDGGSTYYLPRLIGMRQAKRLCMLGDRISATEAHELGLITKLVADNDLEAETTALAARLARSAPYGLANCKQLLNQSLDNNLTTQLAREAGAFGGGLRTEDFVEGVAAFMSKRAPVFRGR